jgi:oxygen-independent coproporphyrinogen-3 oxidase
MNPELDLSGLTPELLAKYDKPGPRYTSYPTAPLFSPEFDETAYRERLQTAATRPNEPLSLYVHLPFCEQRCTFCGCNVVVSPRRGPEKAYLKALDRELGLLGRELDGRNTINQLHWGGGTPTYLDPSQCRQLMESITSRFDLTPDAEVAVEVDPCVTTLDHLRTLRELGFNRVSMGLQDVDPAVQQAINRIQPLAETRELVEAARSLGYASVNLDLIYGLPLQEAVQFRSTVRTVIRDLEPDRVACFSYAHVPWIKPHQKRLEDFAMATGWDKLQIFTGAAQEFVAGGYTFVGFDHFSRPGDELAQALGEDRVHRNFMGYTVMPASDQVGVGCTAIGDVAGAFAANHKKLITYQREVTSGRLAVERGLVRSSEDELRRAVINRLICTLRLDFDWIESAFGVDPREHFDQALVELAEMAGDGLVEIDRAGLRVTPTGRFFLRNLCMPFDAYLAGEGGGQAFSRTV